MIITFITNLIHHHQVNVADEIYSVLGDSYHYIATEELYDWLKKGGYQKIDRPYLLKAYESKENKEKALKLALESDVVILGSAPTEYIYERLKQNKLTFRYSERWFKTGYYRLLKPSYLKDYYNKHIRWRNKNYYLLCASAFAPNDANIIFSYPNKCLKWGYFTAVPELDIVSVQKKKRLVSTLKILWVARFLKLKHPERMLQLATMLLKAGFSDFVINMVGSGEEFDSIKQQISDQGLGFHIKLLGNFPNDQIHTLMREHHIFCFTSDENEGWGAVLNEAMSNGCAVVASHVIGSVPYLIKNAENGFIYNSNSLQDLFEKVKYLIDHPDKREVISIAAYNTMHDIWSPRNAARNLLKFVECKLSGQTISISEGPCSKANPIRINYYK